MQTTIDFGVLLASLREIRDQKDAINAQLKKLNEREAEAERAILDAMTAAGLTAPGQAVKAACGSATRHVKWRAAYDPERWPQVVEWCCNQGRTDLIQRRLTDAKIMELVDSGTTLPEGMTVQPFEELYFRRS